tara:strand:- start:1451 stop:1738 length:288 start_codon:yes stop_codon:yes gene_type:complete
MDFGGFEPGKHGPVATMFAVATAFVVWIFAKAKSILSTSSEAGEIKTMIGEGFQQVHKRIDKTDGKIDDVRDRVSRMEGANEEARRMGCPLTGTG